MSSVTIDDNLREIYGELVKRQIVPLGDVPITETKIGM